MIKITVDDNTKTRSVTMEGNLIVLTAEAMMGYINLVESISKGVGKSFDATAFMFYQNAVQSHRELEKIRQKDKEGK